MRLSILMPVFNERATIAAAVERVRALPLDMQIICVDGCSTDGSLEVLKDLLERKRIE